MKPCHSCQTVIDEYILDKQLEPLRELTADDFNVCTDCATIVADACVKCGSAVYVPRSESAIPDYCPAYRSGLINRTGHDPAGCVVTCPPERRPLSNNIFAGQSVDGQIQTKDWFSAVSLE